MSPAHETVFATAQFVEDAEDIMYSILMILTYFN
jgi:hypothetical protein